MKITTPSGFKCIVYEENLDDPDVFLRLTELDKGHMQVFPEITEDLLGKGAYQRLADHVRDEKGKSSFSRMVQEFYLVLKTAGELKKK